MARAALQLNASDPAQVAFAREQVTRREARAHELWRWLLSQKMGREFLFTQVLEVLGPFRPIAESGDVALHNLGYRWVRDYVQRHRDLYLQMVAEEVKRQEEEWQALDAAQETWRQRQQETEA